MCGFLNIFFFFGTFYHQKSCRISNLRKINYIQIMASAPLLSPTCMHTHTHIIYIYIYIFLCMYVCMYVEGGGGVSESIVIYLFYICIHTHIYCVCVCSFLILCLCMCVFINRGDITDCTEFKLEKT